jgi:DNA polymerase I
MKALITNIRYGVDNGELIVHLYGRGEDGKRLHHELKNTQPHFYVLAGESVPKTPEVLSVEPGYRSIFNDPLKKVNVRYPFDVPKIREKLNHFEADIIYEYRVRYDYGIKGQVVINTDGSVSPRDTIGDIKPKICYLDIEVDNSHGGWTPDLAEGEILSMSLYDSGKEVVYVLLNIQPHPARSNFLPVQEIANRVAQVLNEKGFGTYQIKIITCENELELLQKYKTYMIGPQAPDILVAWNGWGYDFPYIEARFKKNRISPPLGLSTFDIQWGYSVLYRTQHGELESSSLQSCASRELGTGKIEFDSKIYELYRNDIALFIAYNIVDTILMLEMNKKVHIVEHYQTLSEVSGIVIDDTSMETRIVENMVFYKLRGSRVVLPSRPEHIKNADQKAKGAAILEPSKGIFENVVVFDLKGEYPNIIRTFNISPETILVGNPDLTKDYFKLPVGLNTRTVKEPRGLLPQILDDMMELRNKMKAEMSKHDKGTKEYDAAFANQEAFKWVMNSVIGVLDNEHFRLSDRLLFNNVTAIARMHLHWIADYASKMGYAVRYGDTDSVMISIPGDNPEEIVKKAKDIEYQLNQTFPEFIKQFGASTSTLKVEFKKLYSKWFQGGKKKKYAGITIWDGGKFVTPEPDITGFESKRSSTPLWTRRIQKELLQVVLTSDKATVEKFVKDSFNEFVSGKVPPEEIGIPITINREEYANNAIQKRAYEYSNVTFGTEFGLGSKIRYYYVKKIKVPGALPTDVIAIDVDEKFPTDKAEIDMGEHIRRCFTLPLGPVVEAIGINIEDIVTRKTTMSLMDFK